jgi:hypothetical protein
VDATTKFQWEAIKRLATKAQEVEDRGNGKAQEVEDKDKGQANVIEVENDNWVTMNYCLILIQSSELVLCTSSIILIMPCNELMSWTLWNV